MSQNGIRHQNDAGIRERSFVINGKYQILKRIWSGAFGIVYLGKDLSISRYVAIKELHPRLLKEPKFVEMFIEEANILASLNHPNIVNILELVVSEDRKRFFIIMEYIQGVNLHNILSLCQKSNTKLPTEIATYIICETSKALEQCHQNDIIHRDLNPNNVMLSVTGHIKLIDFGVAKSALKRNKSAEEGFMIGKISYMAPEQLLGKKDVGHLSDVYSLGVMLYEVLDGTPLFQGKDKEALIKQVTESNIDKIIFEKDEDIIPVELKQLILMATQKDADKRNISSADFHDRIEDFLHRQKAKNLANRCKKFLHELLKNSPVLASPEETVPDEDADELENIHGVFPSAIEQATPTPTPSPVVIDSEAEAPVLPGLEAAPSEEDEQVTVWERVVIAGRKHVRILKTVFTVIPICLVAWGVLDVLLQITQFGQKVYDIINPPSLIMNTIPENAVVKIDGAALKKRTPVSVPKLSAGLHEIVCELEGFENINEVIDIPSGKVRKKPIEYIKPFSRQVRIESNPDGASILMNDLILSEKTPYTVTKAVDEPLRLALSHDGFTTIEDFELDLQSGGTKLKDRRVWNLDAFTDSLGVLSYVITGHFFKNIQFYSNPAGANIYIDGETKSAGKSPKTITLTAGSHEIRMSPPKEYDIYNSSAFRLDVDRRTPAKIWRQLRKKIVIRAEDFDGNPLSANLVFLNPGPSGKQYEAINKPTPYHGTLGCYDSQILIKHPDYRDTSAVLDKKASELVVRMQRKQEWIQADTLPPKEDEQEIRQRASREPAEDRLNVNEESAAPGISGSTADIQNGLLDEPAASEETERLRESIADSDQPVQVEIAVMDDVDWRNLEGVRVSVRDAHSDDPYVEIGTTDQNGVLKTKIDPGAYDFLFKKDAYNKNVIRNHRVSEELGSEIVCNLTRN